jgi:Domain of unknown function (DUF6456)
MPGLAVKHASQAPEVDWEIAALRLLRALDEMGGRLGNSGSGLALRTFDAREGGGGRAASCALARHCLEQDWLRRDGETLVLTEAGRSRLRRDAGSEDFLRQHQIRVARDVDIGGTRRPVVVDDGESPLGWLKSRKDRSGRPLISAEQYEAGERLRADYWFAQLSPRVTANWTALAPAETRRRGAQTDAASLRDNVIAAKARVVGALQAVGPELAGVLIDVCCELKGLEEAEKAEGWPARSGKVVLQIALTRLARHYGYLGADANGPAQGRRLRHWGTEDYRPTLDAWTGTGSAAAATDQ